MRWLMVIVLLLIPTVANADPTKEQLDRLEKLANFLDYQVPANNFDIQNWGNTPNPDDPNYIGCAGGWSTKFFASEGFHYEYNGREYLPTYRDKKAMDALTEFFGVSFLEARFLFSNKGGAGRDPHKAATNIRILINKYRAEQLVASSF